MRIIVCVKHVPSKLIYDFKSQSIIRNGVDSDINPYDLYAIETALRLRDRYGGKVFSLCMGVSESKQTLTKSIALGVDEAYLLCDKRFAGADTFSTSYILAKGIKKTGDYDIIVCGRQSSDGDTGQVGVELAEKLQIPFITNAYNVEIQNSKVFCDYISDRKKVTVSCNMPCLITIEKGCCETRIPTIKNFMRSIDYNVTEWCFDDLDVDVDLCGLSGSYTRVRNTYTNKRELKNPTLILGTVDEQASFVKGIVDQVIGVMQ